MECVITKALDNDVVRCNLPALHTSIYMPVVLTILLLIALYALAPRIYHDFRYLYLRSTNNSGIYNDPYQNYEEIPLV